MIILLYYLKEFEDKYNKMGNSCGCSNIGPYNWCSSKDGQDGKDNISNYNMTLSNYELINS